MIPTPRTDEWKRKHNCTDDSVFEFARTLERELIETSEELDAAKAELENLHVYAHSLKQELTKK